MLIVHAKVYTMSEDGVIKDGFVLTNGQKIENVGFMSSCPDFEDQEDVIDARGMYLLPGFIDAFTMMGTGYVDNLEMQDNCEGLIAPHLRAIDCIDLKDSSFREALVSGVTSVAVSQMSSRLISGQVLATKTHGNRIDDMVINPLVAVRFSLSQSSSFLLPNTSRLKVSFSATIREELLKAKKYVEDKEFAISNLDRFEAPPYDIKHEALVDLLEKDIPAYISVESRDEIFTAMRIAREFSIRFVLINPLEAHVLAEELLVDSASVLCAPFSAGNKNYESCGSVAKIPGILTRMRVQTAIISYHPKMPSSYLLLAAAIAVREGMDKMEALKAITIYPAKICNIQNRVGSIEKGKDADFVMFSKNPLETLENPKFVVCNGEKIIFNF
ncbi:MAG: amidohydrolase family protein [Oscillospiraceae bacterium]|jgi:imidazolonepropionase-like amidohydrolase|nr:amidohydrolase family protein [Oscillospiraceae bacterium]